MAVEKPVIGIDLGGTNMQVGIVRPDARSITPTEALLGSARKKTKGEDGLDAVLDRLEVAVGEACESAGLALSDLGGLGIGAPAAVNPEEGMVLNAVNLRWNDVPLAAILRERFDLPTAVENDVNVALYGEWVLGAAKGARNVLGVWVGTGIGGGLILNGDLYYGHSLTAGEIGHMLVFPRNPPGSRSLEQNCSRTSVVERIVRLIRSNHPSMLSELTDERYEKIKSKALATAYLAGDELTREVIDDSALLLGDQIGSVVSLLSLEMVVLGGGLTEAIGEPFVERVRSAVQVTAFPDVCQNVAVVASELEDNAGLLGAAMIAVDRLG